MQRALWKRRKEIVTEVVSVADNLFPKTPWKKSKTFIDSSVEKILLHMNFQQLPKQKLRMVFKQ